MSCTSECVFVFFGWVLFWEPCLTYLVFCFFILILLNYYWRYAAIIRTFHVFTFLFCLFAWFRFIQNTGYSMETHKFVCKDVFRVMYFWLFVVVWVFMYFCKVLLGICIRRMLLIHLRLILKQFANTLLMFCLHFIAKKSFALPWKFATHNY